MAQASWRALTERARHQGRINRVWWVKASAAGLVVVAGISSAAALVAVSSGVSMVVRDRSVPTSAVASAPSLDKTRASGQALWQPIDQEVPEDVRRLTAEVATKLVSTSSIAKVTTDATVNASAAIQSVDERLDLNEWMPARSLAEDADGRISAAKESVEMAVQTVDVLNILVADARTLEERLQQTEDGLRVAVAQVHERVMAANRSAFAAETERFDVLLTALQDREASMGHRGHHATLAIVVGVAVLLLVAILTFVRLRPTPASEHRDSRFIVDPGGVARVSLESGLPQAWLPGRRKGSSRRPLLDLWFGTGVGRLLGREGWLALICLLASGVFMTLALIQISGLDSIAVLREQVLTERSQVLDPIEAKIDADRAVARAESAKGQEALQEIVRLRGQLEAVPVIANAAERDIESIQLSQAKLEELESWQESIDRRIADAASRAIAEAYERALARLKPGSAPEAGVEVAIPGPASSLATITAAVLEAEFYAEALDAPGIRRAPGVEIIMIPDPIDTRFARAVLRLPTGEFIDAGVVATSDRR